MQFSMSEFGVVFALVFATYWIIPVRARVWLLLFASFYLYSSWNKWLALIVAGSSTFDYLIGRAIQSSSDLGRRRLLACFSIVANLCLLGYFKYANFFLDSLTDAFHLAGIPYSLPTLSILLPVGISFYTFEAISYTVDVYQRKISAERNLAHFMLFITFFPHLVAGPIVRAAEFLPQINRPRRLEWSRIRLGMEFCILGLVKKLIIADRMGQFVDPVMANPGDYGSAGVWIAVAAYTTQLFCDFSGYSDLAVGTGYLLGYRLPFNFQTPYLALNIGDFWKRWHISLSKWIHDYLFVPLSRCRRGSKWALFSLVMTMVLVGLWHGAHWNFAIFGLLHGTMLVVHRQFRRAVANRRLWQRFLNSYVGLTARVALTLTSVMVSLVIFRAPDFTTCLSILRRMFIPTAGQLSPMPLAGFYLGMLLMAVGHLYASSDGFRLFFRRLPAPVLGTVFACAVLMAMLFAPDSAKAFIYFQF